MTATDFVRSPWLPEDDQLLRSSIEGGASLAALAKGAVNFSCKFTLREIRDRWHSLLYDPDVSNQASAHMAELELSGSNGSNPQSKSALDNLKAGEKIPEKRKNRSIRRHYYTMRKRIKNDFFSSQNLPFFEEPNLHSYNHQEHTTDGGDSMLDDCLANNLGFEEKDFEILRQAFPETLASIPTTATTVTTTVIGNQANSFHLERCNKSPENDIINGSIDIDKSVPSETPPSEKLTKNGNSIFGGKHLFNSPVSDGSASFNTIGGFSSPSTRLPLWKTMEDISVPDLPVDDNNAESHLVVEEGLVLHDDKHSPEYDGAHGLISCIEYTDSLLNFSNEDDILLLMDTDAKEVDISSNECREESKDSLFHGDQVDMCHHQELIEGKIICSLNTEDPDIPCNDDIFLLIHPSTQFAPSVRPQIAKDHISPLSSSSLEKDGEHIQKLFTGGRNALAEFVSPHNFAGSPFKCEPLDCEYWGPLPGKPNNLRNPSQTMPNHTPSGNGKLEEDASKVEPKGLTSSLMYKEMPLPLEVGSVKMTDLVSLDDAYISENNSDSDGDIPYFSDVEAMILEMDLVHSRESSITNEVARYQNEDAKRLIMRLEHAARSSFKRFMSSHGALAILYSRHMTHYIKKVEVTIGRSTDDTEVDIDLRKEGHANKISRRQAIIKMETDGSFSLKNLGASSISLNGKRVAHGEVVALASNSLIEIRGMSFGFDINDKYVRRFLGNKPS